MLNGENKIMVKKNLLKSLSVVMACMMAVMTVACGSNTVENKNAAATEETAKESDTLEHALLTSAARAGSSEEAGKVETVYVTANASGAVDDVIVSEWLKNANSSAELSDTTELKNIVNVKGKEGFTENSDGSVTWDANGSDIYYQGTTDKELPVDMKITYTLDGKEIAPEDLAGKSGKVTIRFEYDNKEKQVVDVDGKEIEVYTPFAMVSGMMLDSDKFTNVEISNGKVISEGNKYIVMGVALPGLKESLNISDEKWDELETDEDIESKLSNYFEITADTSDFELGMTITMASSDILSDFGLTELSDGNKLSDLKDDMGELNDGSTKLVDGTTELKDGTTKLRDGSKELYDGTGKLYDGTSKLKDGTADLYSGAGELNDGAGQLDSGSSELAKGAGELRDGASKLHDGTKTLSDGTGKLYDGSKTLYGGIVSYTDGAAKVDQGAGALAEGTKSLKAGSEQLGAGLSSAKTGSAALAQGALQLESGVQSLGGMTDAVQTLLSNKATLESAYGYLTTPGTSCDESLVPLLNKMSDHKITSAEQADAIKAAGLAALSSQTSATVTSENAGDENEVEATGGELTNPDSQPDDTGKSDNTDQGNNGAGDNGSGEDGSGDDAQGGNGSDEGNNGSNQGNNDGNVVQDENNNGANELGNDGQNNEQKNNQNRGDDYDAASFVTESKVVTQGTGNDVSTLTQQGDGEGRYYTEEEFNNEVEAALQKALPAAVKEALPAAVEEALSDPEVVKSLLTSEQGMNMILSSPELLTQMLANENVQKMVLSNPEILAKIMANEDVQKNILASEKVQDALKGKIAEQVSLVSTYTGVLGSVKGAIGAVDEVLTGLGLSVTAEEEAAGVTVEQKAMVLSTQMNALMNGVGSLKTGAEQLDAGIAQLLAGATSLDAGIGQVDQGAATLAKGTGALVANNEKLKSGAKELSDGAGQLNSGASELRNGAGQLSDGATQLSDGAGKLSDGASQLHEGTGKLYDGAGKLDEGAGELNTGAKDLNEGAGKLNDGIAELDDGVVELLDGVKKLDSEGIKKLYDAFDGDFSEFSDKLKAIQKAGESYTSFGGANEDEDCSVKFIIKTAGVKAQDL
ncbi:MAG: hypothetical protein E7306_07160 [Butyrivibrio sp.]|nr:hypothetical protein [Butyrivibrio sp.]